MRPWKEKIKVRNLCDCEKEIKSKSSYRWYRLVKDGGRESYNVSLQGYEGEGVWLMFIVSSLLQNKRRCRMCRMCSDDRCVICGSGEVEDVGHFL